MCVCVCHGTHVDVREHLEVFVGPYLPHSLRQDLLLPAACAGSAGPETGIFLLHLPSLCRMVLQMCAGIRDECRLYLGLGI